MYTAQIKFRRPTRGDRQEYELATWDYLLALQQNGQIADCDFVILPVRGGYKAIVGMPEKTSLQASRPSRHVRKASRALTACGVKMLKAQVLGEDLNSGTACECRKSPSLVLEANLLSHEAPLRCGECFGRVPLYRIPHINKYGTYEDILGWARRYRLLDELWITSGEGEQFAYRQLCRHDSDLSKTGREICQSIEKNTGIPTYYYLYRYYARSLASERERPCPKCGKKWLREPHWMEYFDFRCDRCRLVSNIAWDVRG